MQYFDSEIYRSSLSWGIQVKPIQVNQQEKNIDTFKKKTIYPIQKESVLIQVT